MSKATAFFPVLLAGLFGAAGCLGTRVADAPAPAPGDASSRVASGGAPAPVDASGRAASGVNGAGRDGAEATGASTAAAAGEGEGLAASAPEGAQLAGTAVLHIGDSFTLAGFAQALRPKLKALGVRYEVRAETSSYTTTWAGKLGKLVADMQPDLVIINLGANEVENTDPSTHAPHVRRIVRAIGGRPCVWVSPPLWRKDTGITEVIRENSAPCRFFDSNTQVSQPIPRQSDRIHPSDRGGAIWAEAFWSWLSGQRAVGEVEGGAALKPSPWRLRPAPPEEHRARAGESQGARAALQAL